MTLESIMSAINTGDGVDIMKEAHSSISTIKDEVFYVQPNYEEIKKDSEAKFIIFSAPGASGKSALAKYIAFKHKGIYWDLSQITLGENSFHGTLWCFLQDLFGKKCRTFWRILHLQIGENCRGTGRSFFTDRVPVQA